MGKSLPLVLPQFLQLENELSSTVLEHGSVESLGNVAAKIKELSTKHVQTLIFKGVGLGHSCVDFSQGQQMAAPLYLLLPNPFPATP